MTQAKANVIQIIAPDEELIDVLSAISVVSMRLARKLTLPDAKCQSEEGGKTREQNQRYGSDHR